MIGELEGCRDARMAPPTSARSSTPQRQLPHRVEVDDNERHSLSRASFSSSRHVICTCSYLPHGAPHLPAHGPSITHASHDSKPLSFRCPSIRPPVTAPRDIARGPALHPLLDPPPHATSPQSPSHAEISLSTSLAQPEPAPSLGCLQSPCSAAYAPLYNSRMPFSCLYYVGSKSSASPTTGKQRSRLRFSPRSWVDTVP